MSTLLLVRHGQASLGAARYDALSPLGVQQAEVTGRHLAQVWAPPTRVLCGPRDRHRGTWAAMAAAWPGLAAAEPAPELDELAETEALGRVELSREQMLAAIQGWASGTRELPGVQPVTTFRRRVTGWLQGVARGDHGQRVVAVTSAGVVAMATVHLLGLPDPAVLPLIQVLRNASLTEVAFSGGRVSLVSYNSVGHLPAGWRTTM
jgi:broad specificity phosphatase PhoE